jgi:ribosomal protein S18 acetylase RimI-like enzyme
MEETLVIRSADSDDINTIGFLAHQIWPEAYGKIITKEQIQYMLHQLYRPDALLAQMRAGQQFLLAEVNLESLGFAAYSSIDDHIWKLHKLYVLPHLQGKGIGRALLDVVKDTATEAGASQLILNVNRNNPALRFYERYGFQLLKTEDIDIGEGYFMNDYVLGLSLADPLIQ